jgi:endonuclease G
MPNAKCEFKLDHYCCSIDSIEKITGLNFFHKLPDDTEASLEAASACTGWLPAQTKQEAEVLDPTTLPRNTFNTEQAAFYAGKRDEITVCGKVVSTKLSSKGNIFLNLDKPFPNHIFTVTIFKDQVSNFSYLPHEFLKDKTICIQGTVTKDANGVAGMIIKNESAIEVRD